MILTSGGFKILRDNFGRLNQSQVDQLNLIVSEFDKDKSISYPQAAYMLATAWHETDKTLLPIEEYGKGRKYDYGRWKVNSKGQEYCFKNGNRNTVYLRSEYDHLYYGRGLVQLTWFDNYKKAGEKLEIDFLNHPEFTMVPENAVRIMILGMKEGWFTTRKLSDYINQSKKDYENARRIINGTDRAKMVAGYANIFEKALRSR